MTKRGLVEVLFKCCLVIMALVVFGNQTSAEGTADDEVLVYTNKMYLPIVSSIQVTDAHPSYMRSYYVETLTGMYSLGCAQGTYAMSVGYPDSYFMFMDFGNPYRDSSLVLGTKLYDYQTFVTTGQISYYLTIIASGFADCNNKDKLFLAAGTNTSGDFLWSIAYDHGYAWAEMVYNANQSLQTYGIPSSRVTITSGINTEPGFNSFSDTVQWFDGFNDHPMKTANFIIGSADGCPDDYPPATPPQGDVYPAECYNGWTQDDINKINNGYITSAAIPMNFLPNGYQASQWYRIGLYTYYVHNNNIDFFGVMTQEAACEQRELEDPEACSGMDNSLYFGYQQFRSRVVSDSRMNSFLLWGADMKYYRGAP